MAIRYTIPKYDSARYYNAVKKLAKAKELHDVIENTIINDFINKYGVEEGVAVEVEDHGSGVVKTVGCLLKQGKPYMLIHVELDRGEVIEAHPWKLKLVNKRMLMDI